MRAGADPERFAAFLRSLKERSGLSYEALAPRTGSSRSTLHRYCSGSYVPPDYGPVHRFASACGASPSELRELHRLWAVADMSRAGDERTGSAEVDASASKTEERAGPGPDEAAPPSVAAAEAAPSASVARRHRLRRALPILGVCFLLLTAGGTWLTLASRQEAAAEVAGDGRLLFSPACAEPVGMGQHDACVKEVQRLLAEAGADIDVDSSFGPQTLRRVTAFQVLHGLDADGMVGAQTKKALYDPKERIRSWSPRKVRQHIRQVFTEEPGHAVAIADCQSFLDPLHILPNTNGSRNWGVFQISDTRLRELGGTPLEALQPEWNIQAAHRLYKRAGNFDDWPHCERAYVDSRTPEPSSSPTRS
ncbi:helix-turn-helix domain-containing protein [Streptomyces bottropensis]|uniref:helix-turn-helix domain-containing protein n=1 Tax=Streptomyces bottropensis TaxID=42235 RepID=UPI0036A1715A